jgi:c-di-GMP-binding flagellar brake protein YcgR
MSSEMRKDDKLIFCMLRKDNLWFMLNQRAGTPVKPRDYEGIRLYWAPKDIQKTARGVTWNLSQGGMQLEVSDLKPQDAVRLSFQLPDSAVVIDVAGIVVWANEERQGIQFTTVSARSQQSISQFIADVEKTEC